MLLLPRRTLALKCKTISLNLDKGNCHSENTEIWWHRNFLHVSDFNVWGLDRVLKTRAFYCKVAPTDTDTPVPWEHHRPPPPRDALFISEEHEATIGRMGAQLRDSTVTNHAFRTSKY